MDRFSYIFYIINYDDICYGGVILEIDRIQTLQYMGSKSRMLESICNPILCDDDISTVVDLFAGTGSVGYACSKNKRVISNDLEYYSFVLNEAVLNGCNISSDELNSFWLRINERFNQVSLCIKDALKLEEKFLTGSVDSFQEYAYFSDNTPSVFNPNTCIDELKAIEELVSKIVPGKRTQNVPFPCLFLTYYANAYFGIRQCCQIDSIVSEIQMLQDKRQQYVLFAALMSALSICATTTTHFAQFLKVKNQNTFTNVRTKRSLDVVSLFAEAVERFNVNGLLNKSTFIHECYNLDYEQFLVSVKLDSNTVVYADPPYFKEHYSRYYHVLNTLCLYDYPELAINPQTKNYSVGRYRTERNTSDFGKKAKALAAFDRMINICANKRVRLVISYSENSIVKIYELLQLAEKRYHVTVNKIKLMHSSQGRSTETDQKVNEYIFFCDNPDSIEVRIEKAAEEIKKIKPVVDNPGGFIHNYMARKPYNVVSKIIELFTEENDLVYDPMFGSGTCLIEASKLGRRAVGCDINPIAYKICKTSLTRWDIKAVFDVVDRFVKAVEDECEGIYEYKIDEEIRVIERCHFDVINDVLIPTKYWYKTKKNGLLSGRKPCDADDGFCKAYESFSTKEIDRIKNKKLIPNSRIAIKNDATVYNYFCSRNLYALNQIISILDTFKGQYGYELFEIIVSSAINLIKLSDKKASSQMPYWLPQSNATSRNAVFIIQQKAEAIKEGIEFLSNECKLQIGNGINVYNIPAQTISAEDLADNTVDLVLTDPPYTDQVPYLEYSQLWFDILDIENEVNFVDELVVSDAPSRSKDNDDFNNTMAQIIKRNQRALKDHGLFIMFYHSFDLKSWVGILKMMQSEGLRYVYQIPTATPRKSFKTVLSPRSTLDGNYLVFFIKDASSSVELFDGTIEDAEALAYECAYKIICSSEKVTTQDLYDRGMLKEAFERGYLEILSKKYKTFADVLKDKLKYCNGYWEV